MNNNNENEIINRQVEVITKALVNALFESSKSLDEFSTLDDLQKSLVILAAVEVLYINIITIFLSGSTQVPEEEIKIYFDRLAEEVVKRIKNMNTPGDIGCGGFSCN